MSTAAPNPSNLILLAALGIGAYWFFSRNAIAGATAQTPGAVYGISPGAQAQQYAKNDAALWSGVGGILKNITNSITANQARNNAANGAGQSVAASPSDDNAVFNDGVAANPAGNVNWDAFWQKDTGDLGAYL